MRRARAHQLGDRVERLDGADLVVHEHHRHDDGAVIERVAERVEVDDAVETGHDPSDPEALSLQTVARRQDGLVLERGRDDSVALARRFAPHGPRP